MYVPMATAIKQKTVFLKQNPSLFQNKETEIHVFHYRPGEALKAPGG